MIRHLLTQTWLTGAYLFGIGAGLAVAPEFLHAIALAGTCAAISKGVSEQSPSDPTTRLSSTAVVVIFFASLWLECR